MNWTHMLSKRSSIFVAALMLAGCAMMGGPSSVRVNITGDQEVPAVNTSASGTGTVTVADDRSVSGSFKLQNAAQILVAHIHTGPAGQNGPVIIPFRKVADNEWVVPPGAKLTEAQYELYKKSGLYVNFHSAKYKGGEIRGQIRPASGGGSSSY